MADQISILNTPYQIDWTAYAQETHWPVFLLSFDQPTPDPFTPPPPSQEQCLSGKPGKRRRGFDRAKALLISSLVAGHSASF